MSNDEAKGILRAEHVKLQASSYADLVTRLADTDEKTEAVGLSGTTYHVELQGFWDDAERSALRVVASIDDGGARALLPFTDSFTITPDGVIADHSTP